MSWPVDHVLHILNAIPEWLEKKTMITSQLHIMAPQTAIEPILIVEVGGAIGYHINKTQMTWADENNPQKNWYDPDADYNEGQLVEIPVGITLELDGQGDIFAGRAILASLQAVRWLVKGEAQTIPISSVDFTRVNKDTGETVNFVMNGFDGYLIVDSVDKGYSVGSSEDENGNINYKFIQSWDCIYRFKVSNGIYQDMRL